MPFPGVPWSVVTPGVDIEQCRSGDAGRGRRAFGIPDDALVLSMFARVGPMKGQADFVHCRGPPGPALSQPLRRDVRARRQGLGLLAQAQGLVAEYGLGERLIIPGDVRPPLKDDLVAGSDVVVHPSHAESFGLAVLEAMAAGKPVVAAATDGPRLLIEDGVSGVLVEPGDVDGLTSTVARLLDDPARARRARRGERHACRERLRRRRHGEPVRSTLGRRARPGREPVPLGLLAEVPGDGRHSEGARRAARRDPPRNGIFRRHRT